MNNRRYRDRSRRSQEDYRRFRRDMEERLTDLGNADQLRTLRLAGDRRATVVIRCGRCGHQWPTGDMPIVIGTTCPNCQTALRSCRHCASFDTSARFECRADIEERISDKWAGNECVHFKPIEVLDATGRKMDTAKSARAAFDGLFEEGGSDGG